MNYCKSIPWLSGFVASNNIHQNVMSCYLSWLPVLVLCVSLNLGFKCDLGVFMVSYGGTAPEAPLPPHQPILHPDLLMLLLR